MRLFDKILASGTPDSQMLRAQAHTGRLVVVCCDPVASMYMASPKQEWEFSDFPYAIPPWDIAFCEWNRPPYENLGDGLAKAGGDLYDQMGFISLVERERFAIQDALNDAKAAHRELREPMPDLSSTAYVLKLAPVITGQGGQISFLKTHANIYLDKQGQVLAQVFLHRELHALYADFLQNFLPIVLLSYCFSNTSNTEVVEVDDILPPQKLRRRFNIPDVRRVTLKIGGGPFVRPVYKHTDQSEEPPCDDRGMPLHLCRGSFATYTEEKKLFGKYTGRFWRPPHMRGKREHGEVVKDYLVEVPA